MTLSFTPINELTFADTLASGDYLLVWDVSAANLAKRLTLQVLANFLAAALINIEWEGILNKPDTFPPAIHTHIPADIVGLTIDSLPSGTLIGSIAHFTGETPPATRRDGSPIQIGDRLSFSSTDGDAVFNGLNWVSGDFYASFTSYHYEYPTSYGYTFYGNFPPIVRPSILVREISFQYQGESIFGLCDENNKFDFVLSTKSGNFKVFTVDSIQKITENTKTIFPINGIVSGAGNPYFLIFSANVIGAPALHSNGANLNFGIRWSLIL